MIGYPVWQRQLQLSVPLEYRREALQFLVKANISWNEACYLQELEHGKNIINAAAKLVSAERLERFGISSLAEVKKVSRGQSKF